MNTLMRWGRFNLVGVAGVVVQMAVLAACNRIAPGHYLAATVAAVEVTLLHNFAWHVRYTWKDRVDGGAQVRAQNGAHVGALVRFHLSNGMVSLVGNAVLMQVLVGQGHLPVLLANGIAIVCCSLVNFCVGDRWVFAGV